MNPAKSRKLTDLEFKPLTPACWADLEELFGPRGACGGCWCMFWRLRRSDFERQKGDGNKKAFKRVVASGDPPGLLAYCEGKPIAWCAVAPRVEYTALERSRILKPIDDQPVWSVSCLFVEKPYRRRGVTVQLLKAAAEYAVSRGARIVEGYPVEPKTGTVPDAFAWHGFASTFRKAGFKECVRRSETRPIMRYSAPAPRDR